MPTDLKPCPFCGGEARLKGAPPSGWVVCKDCFAEGAFFDRAAEAIAAWNRRAAPARSVTVEEVAEAIFTRLRMIDAFGQLCVDGDSINDAARAVLSLITPEAA